MTNGCLSSIADGALASAMGLLNGFFLSFTGSPAAPPFSLSWLGRRGGDGTVGL